MNSRFLWSEEGAKWCFIALMRIEDRWRSTSQFCRLIKCCSEGLFKYELLTSSNNLCRCLFMQLMWSWDRLVLFLWCSECILLWDWGAAKLKTTLQYMSLRSVRLLHGYPGQALHLCLEFIICCIRSLSRWLPNTSAGTRKRVRTKNAWSRAGWVKSSPAWVGQSAQGSLLTRDQPWCLPCDHMWCKSRDMRLKSSWSRATVQLGGS